MVPTSGDQLVQKISTEGKPLRGYSPAVLMAQHMHPPKVILAVINRKVNSDLLVALNSGLSKLKTQKCILALP